MIVQCGSSLLKDADSTSSMSVISIDESEQALHPKWQEKVLDFYSNAASLNHEYEPQMFVTTHSEHVLKNAISRVKSLERTNSAHFTE